MQVSVASQTAEFFYAALCGVSLAIFYDLLRALKPSSVKRRIVTAIFDVLFWLAATVVILAFVFLVSGGAIRWYVLFGAACGGFLYFCTLSPLIFGVFRVIIGLGARALRGIGRLLLSLLNVTKLYGRKKRVEKTKKEKTSYSPDS